MATNTLGAPLDPGDTFVLTADPGPTAMWLNGELYAWQPKPGAEWQRFEGPSRFEWLEVTGQLRG